MALQSPERRDLLRIMSRAAAMALYPGFSRWSFGAPQEHRHPEGKLPHGRHASYQALFFSPDQYALLERLTAIIIPADDTPGALEAGASEFIDFYMAHETELAYNFATGLTTLDVHSRNRTGQAFLQLPQAEQEALLRPLAYKAQFRHGEEDLQKFFDILRKYTVIGYYTSRMGMQAIDAPGLRVSYPEFPGCPHMDDPEHLHLKPTETA